MTNGCAHSRRVFPFTALVGLDQAKEALLLLAVDPGLKGVLIAGGPGTAKSLLTRSFGCLLPHSPCPPPFVEAPLGITEDRLWDALDLERTLRTGERKNTQGLLSQASGGVLLVDEINLLPSVFVHGIAQALKGGGSVSPGFVLVGSYDPSESGIPESLRDGVGIHILLDDRQPCRQRVEILNRVCTFDQDQDAFEELHVAETALLRERIAAARNRLPHVQISDREVRRLSLAALRLGVAGHRADVFAVRLALSRAALMGRSSVVEEDVHAAVDLVLLPRALEPASDESHGGIAEPLASEGGETPAEVRDMEDYVAPPVESRAPASILDLAAARRRNKGQTSAARRRTGSGETSDAGGGRYVRPLAARPNDGKLAVEATLRAAAPFQTRRLLSTSVHPGVRIAVKAEDLRWKQFGRRARLLVVFAVDSSGSMAFNRISQAKGAVIRLLQHTYRRRDKVALLSFRGDRSQVLIPPSRSIRLAKRAMIDLPVGGGTPLAAGLFGALKLARQGLRCGVRHALLVLLTDGRANVPMRGPMRSGDPVWRELELVARSVQAAGVSSVVVDTSPRFARGGESETLARLLGGRHLSLSSPDAGALYRAAAAFADRIREEAGRPQR